MDGLRYIRPVLRQKLNLNHGPSRVTVGCFTQRYMSRQSMGQHALPAAYYRGGTSRAVMFNAKDLPANRDEWGPILTGVLGSPDPNGRQLDGMGGGISSLSKVCVIGPSSHPDADVDYTFVQVSIKGTDLDFASNCGNMTSAIGPYTWDHNLGGELDKKTGLATVRIHNTNTKKIIRSTFPTVEGSSEAASRGDFEIDGVAGGAAQIQLDFLNPAGSKTGKMQPTGGPKDYLEVEGVGKVLASCFDVANPCVFVRPEDFGVDPTILPDDAAWNDPTLQQKLESTRCAAAVAMGMSKTMEEASKTQSVPKIVLVSSPRDHILSSGESRSGSGVDVIVRPLSMAQPHRAVPITVALCCAAAARVPGSVVNEALVENTGGVGITLGHSSGSIVVDAKFREKDGHMEAGSVFRTARRLMEGTIFWK